MGYIVTTSAGGQRANWRDPTGRLRSKTFRTKKEAKAFLAEVESDMARGSYVDPAGGKVRFADHAKKWLASRTHEATTTARDDSIMRNHVLPRWGAMPLGKIDHLAVQTWVSDLADRLSPATVAECFRLTSVVMRSAVRNRLIPFNPCEEVRLPARRKRDTDDVTISREEFRTKLLPALPERYQSLAATAAGTGLRWGECVGLRWDAVDLDAGTLRVVRVTVEVAGRVADKPYPKSRAGRREVPLPPFLVELLRRHCEDYPPGRRGEVFTNSVGGVLLRGHFRSRTWRPSLVRAGLLGEVVELRQDGWRATWPDRTGMEWSKEFTTERDAVRQVATKAAGGLRFHDLRHCYATWLVSDGVPVNLVQYVMGHEQASTTLDRYTHAPSGHGDRVRAVFADFSEREMEG